MIQAIRKFERVIGFMDGELYITPRTQRHFMKKYGGFGMSEDVIKALKNLGVKRVRINYEGTKKHVYECDLAKFESSTKCHVDTTMGQEDPQRFVSVKEMEER